MPIEVKVRKAAIVNRQLKRRPQKPIEIQAGDAPIRIGADTGRVIVRQTVQSTPRISASTIVETTNPDLTSFIAGNYSRFMKSARYLQAKFKRYSRGLLVGDLRELEEGLSQHFSTQKERLEKYAAFYRSRTEALPIPVHYDNKNSFELAIETQYSTDLVAMIRLAQECIECLDALMINAMLPLPSGKTEGADVMLTASDDYQKRVERTLRPLKNIISAVIDTSNTLKVNIGDVNHRRLESGAEALGPVKKDRRSKSAESSNAEKGENPRPLSPSTLKQKRREKRENQAAGEVDSENGRFARETDAMNESAGAGENGSTEENPRFARETMGNDESAAQESAASLNEQAVQDEEKTKQKVHFARETALEDSQKSENTENAGSESNANKPNSSVKADELGSEPNVESVPAKDAAVEASTAGSAASASAKED